MVKSFLILLFLIGAVTAFGDHSESSCEEQSEHELVCSEEIMDKVKKEHPDMFPPPPKKKIAAMETTPAPPERPERPEGPEGPVDGGDEYYDEYYDEEYYDDEYYDDEYYGDEDYEYEYEYEYEDDATTAGVKPTGKQGKEAKDWETSEEETTEEIIDDEKETSEEEDGESDEITKKKKKKNKGTPENPADEPEETEDSDSKDDSSSSEEPKPAPKCDGAMKAKAAADCTKAQGKFDEKTCGCSQPTPKSKETEENDDETKPVESNENQGSSENSDEINKSVEKSDKKQKHSKPHHKGSNHGRPERPNHGRPEKSSHPEKCSSVMKRTEAEKCATKNGRFNSKRCKCTSAGKPSSPKTSKHSGPKTSKHSGPKTSKHSGPKTSKHSGPKPTKPEKCGSAMKRTEAEKCAKRNGRFNSKRCKCTSAGKPSSPKTSKHSGPKTSKHSGPKTSKHSGPKTSKHSGPKTSKHSGPKPTKPEKCGSAMKRTEAEKCAKKNGRFNSKRCKCTSAGKPSKSEPRTERPTTCIESSESHESTPTEGPTTCVESSESHESTLTEGPTTCVDSSESKETPEPAICDGEMRVKKSKKCDEIGGKFNPDNCKCTKEPVTEGPTTCIESSESNEEVTTKKPCDCTCSPDCKRRKMIIDVLLKYFYRDVYDQDCCKKNCNCDGAKFPECDESNSKKTGTFDILAKLFKPQGGDFEAGSVEVDGKKLTSEKKEKFGKALQDAVKGLEDVLNS